ncbi:porin [Fodinibius sp.]|uniref:porin n=1 Tax=Fodinibius sp. TaxID=1872440 RepID=UPI002ACD3FAC|nr:porin [Fodinibius sp.]MDZ7658162.1 porin [Fodinibius sp.]
MQKSTIHALIVAIFSLLIILSPSQGFAQEVSFDSNGWQAQLTGAFPVFMVGSNHQNYNTDNTNQFSTRIMSGFNPANLTFSITAPTQKGVTVSGIVQINTHLQGPGIQNDGLFESRIAQIKISGDFGIIHAGKGFGIFNSTSIGDNGSGLGVGRFGGPDAADATLGRIGTGYTYANFNPRVTYTTPEINGFTIKAGLINPEKPNGSGNRSADLQTATPRIEAQIHYSREYNSADIQLWSSGLYQNVNVISQDFSYAFSGLELGSKLKTGALTLLGSYSRTNSIGADGLIGLNISGGTGLDQADVNASQWYLEGTYDFEDILVGGSYGEGNQDSETTPVGASPAIKNQLAMLFARMPVTDNLMLMIELQNFSSDAQADYQAMILGTQFSF